MTREQRRAPRYNLSSLKAVVDGREHDLIDVSAEGVLIDGVEGDYAPGTPVRVTLRVPLMDKVSPLVIEARAVRHDGRGLAANYETPNRTWPQVLRVVQAKSG